MLWNPGDSSFNMISILLFDHLNEILIKISLPIMVEIPTFSFAQLQHGGGELEAEHPQRDAVLHVLRGEEMQI